MFFTRVLFEAVTEASAVKSRSGKNLYQVLSSLPNQGVGSRVAPTKYINNPSLKDSYYEVTKVNLKPGTTHGRAWGVQVLKGRTIQDGKPIEIRGGLKLKWKEYKA
ncbi:uncharacterized protein BX664DRAFT_385492 [Halteromyces radiatus]|uniref:uncharacterized protein n=1 Tax=Halteromyces radiatus TaxID=101107 RepID=UPI00221F2FFF|nr:uncharacterized protein BX664DRAFT_385492 [Halteromyces radiatus]KAI8088909.1 hypothetical protein BX664DRAFT_385492 [Halteromyces radiatus]